MAKKKSYSHVQAAAALEELPQRDASEFGYELLRIFAGYGDGQIRRVKEGPGNAAKDGKTILVKNLIAYRQAPANTIDGDCSEMYDIIKAMRSDATIAKHSPRLYVTSNDAYVVAYDPKENDFYEKSIELIYKDFEFLTPLAGIEKIQYAEEAEADVKSAELMAKLFDDIRRHNNISDPTMVHALNVFMSRLLFCFFAEDTGLFPEENLFTNTLKTHTKEDGSDLSEFIDRVFIAMATAPSDGGRDISRPYSVFPYVNGGLFRNRYPIPVLSRRARTLIINCGEYSWKDINPDIFGSMIQAVITPEQRAGLGMHYTSVSNIKKVIRPLFLDSLEEEFEAACAEAREKIAKRMHSDRATQRLHNLLNRLTNIKFFDPACGSGNFLIISYKLLRELEIRIWLAIRDIADLALLPVSSINLTQFYGIELDEYACDTAKLSLWLAEHQMNVKFNEKLYFQPDTLPLKPSGNIVCGNACRIDWNTVCPHTPDEEVYIMGNPPYLGSSMQSPEQKSDLEFAVGRICKGYKKLDYICAWFLLGAEYIKDSNVKAAFVSTNSINQGEIVEPLWSTIFSRGIFIDFAVTSFRWVNNAKYNAAVYCVIIGLSNKNKNERSIITQGTRRLVSNISPYLTDGSNDIVSKRTKSLSSFPAIIRGCMPYDGGNLLLTGEERTYFLNNYPLLSKLVKRIYSANDFINDGERYCLWVSDEDYYLLKDDNVFLKERFQKTAEMRLASPDKSARLLALKPYQFREFNSCDNSTLIIPSTTSSNREYIPMAFGSDSIIVTNAMYMIYKAPVWLMGVLSSRMNMLWIKTIGGRLKMDYRYTSLCYNTFPFPKLTTAEKEELEHLAQNVINIRDEYSFDLTLGKMYNPETMPEELREAHRQLDLAVERIYRPEPFTSDEERLEHLFKLYSKMTKH